MLNELLKEIEYLNVNGKSVIFCITGESTTGKTTLCKYLYSNYPFYQYISLGVLSKALRFTQNLGEENFEKGNNQYVNQKISKFLDYCITYYGTKGVNTIIDGIQCDTILMSKNNYFSGGIVLKASLESKLKWGRYPDTHFKRLQRREVFGLEDFYCSADKFTTIENCDGNLPVVEVEQALLKFIIHDNNKRAEKLMV